MQTVEELKLLPVWVDPQHLVATAKHIMAGHKLKALGVVANGKLLGTVGLARLAPAADEQRVGEYMDPLVHVIQATTPVREVADLFVQENLEYAIAVRGDRFLGLVTPNMLLKELQRSYDPLTSLPWSDQLRDWGVEQLREGREITILFLDIDDFGLYNKKFGHIVGDRVLKNMAKALLETCDSEREIVVRYGGDEFAIGTLRDRVQAQELADSLAARLERVFVSEAEAPVGFCLGIQGGKRTHERENTHYASTLDNLINMASRDCMAKKREKTQAQAAVAVVGVPPEGSKTGTPREAAVPDSPPMARVVGVYADEHSAASLTTVVLSTGATVVSGVHQRQGKSVLESVAHAAAKALERVDPSRTFELDEVLLSGNGTGEKMVTVTGHLRWDGEERAVAGSSPVQDDLYAAAAEALIRAFGG